MSRALLSLLASLSVTPSFGADPKAVEPVASFALADGWIDFRLERDGKPVTSARVTVLVGTEVWARGETDETGQGTFPRPPGRDCQVVFDLGSGPSAPVPLAFLPDGTVIPTRSPVRDGTAECCVTPTRRTQPVEDSVRSTSLPERLAIGLVVLAFNCICLGVAMWRDRRRNPDPRKTRRTKHERR